MSTTTRQEPTMTADLAAACIAYHAGQAEYSATITTREALRRRILARARQARLSVAWGLRSSIGTRSAS